MSPGMKEDESRSDAEDDPYRLRMTPIAGCWRMEGVFTGLHPSTRPQSTLKKLSPHVTLLRVTCRNMSKRLGRWPL